MPINISIDSEEIVIKFLLKKPEEEPLNYGNI